MSKQRTQISIPPAVLKKIANMGTPFKSAVDQLIEADGTASVTKLEKSIADLLLCKTPPLTPKVIHALSYCCVGEPYDAWKRSQQQGGQAGKGEQKIRGGKDYYSKMGQKGAKSRWGNKTKDKKIPKSKPS